MSQAPVDRPDLAALSGWAPELAKTFVSLASDIALVIDEQGVIRSVAQGGAEPMAPGAYQWVGRAWIDTVSGETRPKIENLLKEVTATGIARRREVNHPLGSDSSIPVAYTAIRLGNDGPVLAVGRDLRAIAAIQMRYVESQQDMERGYWQARQAEARYQLLFQVATDAVLVVDGETLQIIEANRSAARLLGAEPETLRGRHAGSAFEHHARGAFNELMGNARSTGQSGEIRARLLGMQGSTSVLATPFRADDQMRLLVRLRAVESEGTSAALNRTLSRLVDGASDGVVVTDSSGRVLLANPAFLALAHLSNETDAKGQGLMRWLSLADQPLAALVAKVRRDGIARHIEASVRRGHAAPVPVEVSAALLTEGDQECIGFTIHPAAKAGAKAVANAVADAVALAIRPGTARPAAAANEQAADALTTVLLAGVEALSARLDEAQLAALLHETSQLLGLDTEDFAQLMRRDTDRPIAPDFS